MIQRCYGVKCKSYKNYGNRGIEVCREWRDSFEIFYRDMGDCPKGLTLERKDNNGPYSKDNCKWATFLEQQNNKRSNRYITYNNKTQTISQWAREYNMEANVLWGRLYYGNKKWSIEEALTTPLIKKNPCV